MRHAPRTNFTTDVVPGISLMAALSEIRSPGMIPDDHSRRVAEEALIDGRPAFWSTAYRGNQAAMCLLDAANQSGLAVALETYADDTYPSHGKHRLYLLASLVPLNEKAVKEHDRELSAAGEAICDAVMMNARMTLKQRLAASLAGEG